MNVFIHVIFLHNKPNTILNATQLAVSREEIIEGINSTRTKTHAMTLHDTPMTRYALSIPASNHLDTTYEYPALTCHVHHVPEPSKSRCHTEGIELVRHQQEYYKHQE